MPLFDFRKPRDRQLLSEWRAALKSSGKKLVFTNGVFDILHAGHVTYLEAATSLGHALIVGLNSDASVRAIKGPKRPLMHELDRAKLLGALRAVDAVAIFDEKTPFEIITFILPDMLVKGGDYTRETIVGAREVEAAGGQ